MSWQTDSGLPQNSVQAIAQTRDGYLWVGTKEGLARFNGEEFTELGENDVGDIANASITALLEGPDGSLWIGTDGGGLGRLKAGRLLRYSKNEGLLSKRVRALRLGPDGSIWIASTGGVNRFKDERFSGYTEKQGLLTNSTRALVVDRAGAVWIASGEGTNVLQNDAIVVDQTTSGLENSSVRVLHEDLQGALWIVTKAELVCRRTGSVKRYTAQDGIAPATVECIYQDRAGTLWFGTNDGLYRFADGKFVSETFGGAFLHQAILTIAEDRERNLWFGTRDGLKQVRPRAFAAHTTADGLAHNIISCVTEDGRGALWIGTMGGGLSRSYAGELTAYRRANGLLSDRVTAMHASRDGSLWIGFDAPGVVRLKDGRLVSYRVPAGAPESSVTVIYEDRHGTVWLGTNIGLASFREGKFTAYAEQVGRFGNRIRVITEDRDGVLWIGTNHGITRHQGGVFKTLMKTEGLSHNGVMSLHADRDGILWIGTDGGGLNWLKDGKVHVCTLRDGLFSNTVLSILEDDREDLWMTSRQGVFRVARRELLRFGDGETSDVNCIVYGRSDGMASVEGSTGSKPDTWKSRDGRLWFATAKGLHSVDPARLMRNDIPPPVVISRVEVDRNVVSLHDGAILPPGRGELEFSYAALSFTQAEKIRYFYRLEGVDREWVKAGTRKTANYNGVKPGRHRFQVIARNNDGVWNRTGASCEFFLTPHYYQTWWFYALAGAFIVGTGVGSYHLRVRALRLRERRLADLVQERTYSLNQEIAERRRVEEQMVAAQRELLDLSRKAGMADVATGVLHNVGNVLNSVNVSATLVLEQVRESKTANLPKIAAMLQAHSSDLAAFLTSDPKGRNIPYYLNALAEQVAAERRLVTEELDRLRKGIEHIRGIVVMQQDFAHVSGMEETVPLAELMEEALRINAAALSRHGLEVVRDYETGLLATIDRHKVLQVLVNLIQNATQACEESGRTEKHLTVRIARHADRVLLTVIDNGVGIRPENLTRIFAHGFTTRQNGHGFGLHSGALVAKVLGGSLTAHSDGPGAGAAFTLDLPGTNPAAP